MLIKDLEFESLNFYNPDNTKIAHLEEKNYGIAWLKQNDTFVRVKFEGSIFEGKTTDNFGNSSFLFEFDDSDDYDFLEKIGHILEIEPKLLIQLGFKDSNEFKEKYQYKSKFFNNKIRMRIKADDVRKFAENDEVAVIANIKFYFNFMKGSWNYGLFLHDPIYM